MAVSINGPVVTVVAITNVGFGSATIQVQDSSPFPNNAATTVYLRLPDFTPPFTNFFHTLLAGTAPGVTMTSRIQFLQAGQIDLQFQNVQVELNNIYPGFCWDF